MDYCNLMDLNGLDLPTLGYTHQYVGTNIFQIEVGSFVDLYCEDNTTRIEYDKYDDNPNDNKLTFNCTESKLFDLPEYQKGELIASYYPRCLGWCLKQKPQPPKSTGLYLAQNNTNLR